MYNIFYIYNYKYKKKTVKHAHDLAPLNAHTSQERINSLTSHTNKRKTASHLYRAKFTSRIMHQAI